MTVQEDTAEQSPPCPSLTFTVWHITTVSEPSEAIPGKVLLPGMWENEGCLLLIFSHPNREKLQFVFRIYD